MSERAISIPQRQAIETPQAVDTILAFALITHPNLPQPVRIVADLMDYLRDGHLWQGCLFGVGLATDSDDPPFVQLTVPAVDRRLGNALRTLSTRAEVTLEICSSADFDLSKDPREPRGPVTPIIPPSVWELVDIHCTAAELTGRLMMRDYAQEPWPRIHATENRFPGLFR